MSIDSEIARLETAKTSIKEAIVAKGVAVPSGTTLDGFAALIADIMLSITAGTGTTITGLIKGNGSTISAAVAGTDYASPTVSKTATLTTAGWSSKKQTVSVSGVLADNTVVVSPAPASHTAWVAAGIYCSAQASGKLTFTCSTVPTAAITVNVLIMG